MFKKFFAKHPKLKAVGNSLLNAGISAIPGGNIIKEIKENIAAEEGGQGSFDWLRLFIYVALLGVVFGVLWGKIDMDTAGKLFGYLGEFTAYIEISIPYFLA